jgi:uncharacterized protein with von Willebrand factor type A (vWA) domain
MLELCDCEEQVKGALEIVNSRQQHALGAPFSRREIGSSTGFHRADRRNKYDYLYTTAFARSRDEMIVIAADSRGKTRRARDEQRTSMLRSAASLLVILSPCSASEMAEQQSSCARLLCFCATQF